MRAIDRTAVFLMLAVSAGQVSADDWPTYGHDNRRSHVTGESLVLPLTEAWVRRSPKPPAMPAPG